MDNWTLWYITAQSVRIADDGSAASRSKKRSCEVVQPPPCQSTDLELDYDITKRTVRERTFEMPIYDDDSSSRVYVSR